MGKTDTGEGGGLFFPSASWIGLKCNDTVFHDGGRYHIEISPLICHANQSTGFYMITASVMKELKMIVYTSELLNLSVETMNSVVDDIIYLSPCRSVLKILSSIFLIFIKTSCLADWKREQLRRKWIVASISRLQSHIVLIQSWKLCPNLW